METLKFNSEEVISFLETIVSDETANEEQEELLQDYMWSGKLKRNNYTYKFTISQMRKLWNERY